MSMIEYRRFMCQGELCQPKFLAADAGKPVDLHINYCDLPHSKNRYLNLPVGWRYYPQENILRCPRCIIDMSLKHPDTECKLCGSPGYFIDEGLIWIPHACPDGSIHEEIEDN